MRFCFAQPFCPSCGESDLIVDVILRCPMEAITDVCEDRITPYTAFEFLDAGEYEFDVIDVAANKRDRAALKCFVCGSSWTSNFTRLPNA